MIIYDTEYPEIMTPAMLDNYLGRGWYRIGQTIMTTDVSFLADAAFMVYWVRINLGKYQHGKAAKKIAAANSRFSVIHKPFEITAEIEDLFREYKSVIDFAMTDSVHAYLLGESPVNIFNTRLIEIRDGERLIAAGYFDEGENTAAGILNFYHPGYKKYSPGKYLMLEKINFCLRNQHLYFYPGYISNQYPKFNYKLFTGKEAMEVFVRAEQRWLPYLSVDIDRL